MVHMTVDHGVSGRFGTRLAPTSRTKQIGGGQSHTEHRLCGNRRHDSHQGTAGLASVEVSASRLIQYRSCLSTRIVPGKRDWEFFNVSSPMSLVVIRMSNNPFRRGSGRFMVSAPMYKAPPSRMTTGGNEGWNQTPMVSVGMIIPPRGSVTIFISQGAIFSFVVLSMRSDRRDPQIFWKTYRPAGRTRRKS